MPLKAAEQEVATVSDFLPVGFFILSCSLFPTAHFLLLPAIPNHLSYAGCKYQKSTSAPATGPSRAADEFATGFLQCSSKPHGQKITGRGLLFVQVLTGFKIRLLCGLIEGITELR